MVAPSGRDPDIAPFSGGVHLGSSLLVVPAGGEPHLGYLTAMERTEAAATGFAQLTPEALDIEEIRREAESEAEIWSATIARAFQLAGVSPGRVGLGGRFPAGTVHAACSALSEAGWRFEPAHDLLLELRQVKSAAELLEIRASAGAVVEAMRRVAAILAESDDVDGLLRHRDAPLTAGRLRRAIQAVFADHGVDQPEGNIVALGEDAGVPHARGDSERVVEARTALVVDLYPRGQLFADCTRTFCVGTPPPELARAHETVVATLRDALEAVRPGIAGIDLQKRACERFEAADYKTTLSSPGTTTGYVHGLGHGVGFDLHEYPTFRRRSDSTGQIGPGDVFTLEPGLYDAEAGWGVRVEDLCYLGPEGLENLTPLPYELDPNAWR